MNQHKKSCRTERFWGLVGRYPGTGCWPWLGYRLKSGYGRFGWRNGMIVYAHRAALWLDGRRIPEGMQVDHLCRNRACVRPSHLEAVTSLENNRRGESPAMKISLSGKCARGHERWTTNADGRRRCLDCGIWWQRKLRGVVAAFVFGFVATASTGQPTIDGRPPVAITAHVPHEVAPYPGFWHCQTAGNFRYCPCFPLPYTDFVDPETANTGFYRYDASVVQWPQGCPGLGGDPPCVYSTAGGPNHSLTWLDTDHHEKPIKPQPFVPNYYPAPQAPTGLCTVWTNNGNTSVCPGTNYVNKIKANPVWIAGYNYIKPFMDADPGCQAGAITPTPSRTPTPTGPTPTPTPSIFTNWVYQLVKEGIAAGCGPGLYCPNNPVTRAQMAVYLLKLEHGSNYVPPPCVTSGVPSFTDIPCAP